MAVHCITGKKMAIKIVNKEKLSESVLQKVITVFDRILLFIFAFCLVKFLFYQFFIFCAVVCKLFLLSWFVFRFLFNKNIQRRIMGFKFVRAFSKSGMNVFMKSASFFNVLKKRKETVKNLKRRKNFAFILKRR